MTYKVVSVFLIHHIYFRNDNFGPVSLAHHLEVMDELVRRDKNRPSVIMWSTANEPSSNKKIAEAYFKYCFISIIMYQILASYKISIS